MTALILGAVLAVVVLVILTTIRSLIIICPPNRVAVISGRSRQLSDGRTVGYRAIRGGRTLRVPLLERVSWMELNTIPIEVSVMNAYSKGAIPLHVQGIANVKVSSVEGLLQNSVERFLEVPQSEIAAIAKETLEANLRGVLATLTPEEVNEDRLKFAQTLIEEADDDIKTLGLELDVLKIQNVTDEVGYLDSVGRRQTAEVLKEARVAEAQFKAEAEESESLSRQRAEIATALADLKIVEQQNALRVRQAELEAIAGAAEAEAKVAGEKAKVIAEQALEAERVKLETRRLEAYVIAPARPTSRPRNWRPRPTRPRSSRTATPRSRFSVDWSSSTRRRAPTPSASSSCGCSPTSSTGLSPRWLQSTSTRFPSLTVGARARVSRVSWANCRRR